jgi:hypothetical protein
MVACPLGTLWLASVQPSCQKAQQCVDPSGIDGGNSMGSGSCSTGTSTTSAQSDADLSDSREVVKCKHSQHKLKPPPLGKGMTTNLGSGLYTKRL